MSMERGVRYARWIDRRRHAILVGSLLVAAIAAVLAARLPVLADMSSLLPPTARSVRDLRAIEDRARAIATTLVVVESDDANARSRAAVALRDRIRALHPVLGIDVVFDRAAEREYAWSHRWLFAELSDLRAARDALRAKVRHAHDAVNRLYVELDDEAPPSADAERALRDKLAQAETAYAAPNQLISSDGRLQLIMVRNPFGADDVERDRGLRTVLEQVAVTVQEDVPNVAIGLAGDPIVTVAEHDAVLDGMLLATLATAILVLLGLGWYFRSAVIVGALGWSLAVGTLVTFAFTWFAIGHLNLASAFLASIVIGNGINVDIVVSARYLEELRRGDGPADALARTLAATFRGTLAAALTAAVAYGSLSITVFDGFRHFGIIGAVGILFCWASGFLVLPAALAVAQRRGLAARAPAPLGRWLARLLPRRPRGAVIAAALGSCVAVLAAGIYLVRDPFEHDVRHLRSHGGAIDEQQYWMDRIEAGFGRGLDTAFVVATPSRDAARAAAKRLREVDVGMPVHDRLFASVTTLDDVLPRDQERKLAVLGELRTLLSPDKLAQLDDDERALALRLRPPDDLRAVTEADIPNALAAPFIETDGQRGRIILATMGAGYEPWDARDAVRFATNVRALGLGDDVHLGGAAFMFADVTSAVLHDGPRASLVALFAAILIVLLVVGPNRHGVIAIACGLGGTVAMLACAAVLGLAVNFLDFIALPITIGIGIEYAVNIATREQRDGDARHALATTGAAVVVCSFTTIVGYGSLLLSRNMGIRSFGLAALLGELTCVAVAVIVAPAALALLRRRAMPAPPLRPSHSSY